MSGKSKTHRGREPKTPLEAAIDRATGYKPEDMVKSAALKKQEAAETETEEADPETEKPETETEKPETGTEKPETGTEEADSGTEEADSGTEEADSGTEKPETGTERRDWVKETYETFIKNAKDIDPTDPVKAVEAYFQKNATDELKVRCKAEGKDAKGCWKFIVAVARQVGGNCHIDPSVVYAMAMHWFEDVPKDWDAASAKASASAKATADKSARQAKPKKPTTRKERLEERVSHGSSKAKAELRELKEKERAKAKASASAAKPLRRDKKRPKQSQGFFFEMLETPVVGGEGRGDESPRTEQESEVKS